LEIRLYWQAASASNFEYQPAVQLLDVTGSKVWAVSQPLNFEGGKISALAPGQFMSDGHTLKLFDDVPNYVGRISVQLIRKDEGGARAEAPDGSNRIMLPEVIQIHGPTQAFGGKSREIRFGDVLTLHCLETSRSADEFAGILHWEVLERPALDYHQFVHGMDAEGVLVAQNDGEPLDGAYPTSHWRQAEHIQSKFSLQLVEGVSQIAYGLYHPLDGKRLPVVVDGKTLDRITLAPENAPC
jgi:hypothetical protein